jgi:hypothetical protein
MSTVTATAEQVVDAIDDAIDALADFATDATADMTGLDGLLDGDVRDALALLIRSAIVRHLESILDGRL